MKLLILLYHRFELWQVPAWFVEKLQQEFPDLEVSHRNTYDDVAEFLRDAEIVFTLSLRPEQFRTAQKLKWIHCPAAAVHQLIYPELVNSRVVLTNGSQIHGPVVAEHVIALILALSKDLHLAARFQQRHVWAQEEIWNALPRPRKIAGATLGLVGVGSIGRNVARHASALGMKVIATRQDPKKPAPDGVSEVLAADQIDSLLQRSDYVVLAAPVTDHTERLINRERLLLMKPDACLINVGRGQLVDGAALGEALRERRIGGAALDVFEQEPLPKDSPLWELDNVLITPHTGGLAARLWERQYDLFSENLRRYLAGRSLLAVVDKQRGY